MKTREVFVSFSNINCDRPFFQPNIYKIEKKNLIFYGGQFSIED